MLYKKTDKCYVIRFERGEEFISGLQKFVTNQKIVGGYFSGIGAIQNVKLSYYDFEKQEYIKKDLKGDYEVASMNGNISFLEDTPVIHCHAALADKKLNVVGGHISQAKVAVTVEIFLIDLNFPLKRKFDNVTGLNLLDLS